MITKMQSYIQQKWKRRISNEILQALDKADKIKDKPTMIIANTIKGKGVPMMENKAEWHGKACTPDELKECLKELDQND